MANNPYVNKVVFGSATLVDLTGTTATADKIMQGYGAFGADGAWMDGTASGGDQHGTIWQDGQGYVHLDDESGIALQSKSVTPSESQQIVDADEGYYALDTVTVGAISSSYVGSGVSRRSSSDLTASGATVTAPAGYYSSSASKTVASGAVVPSIEYVGDDISVWVDNTGLVHAEGGYSATEYPVSTSGWINSSATTEVEIALQKTYQLSTQAAKTVTPTTSAQTAVSAGKYTTGAVTVAAMPTGTAGTPTATKGTVSNHAVTVTPSVTNTAGYITGGTKTGTAVTVSASELVSGAKSITANGTGIDVSTYSTVNVAVPSSSPTLITKTITANGTYNASSDSADGYSSVTVNVSGGSSNFIQGTFTAGEAGSVQTITLPYSGNGFIKCLSIFVADGAYNSSETDWWNVIHTYAVAQVSIVKSYMSIAPDYSANNTNTNGAVFMYAYKNSTSNGNNYGRNLTIPSRIYYNTTPAGGSSTFIYITSKDTFKVFVCESANGTYGLLSGVDYTYCAVYSE